MIGKLFLVGLAILKSFFHAVTQVAWGLTGIFAFNLILAYMLKGNQIMPNEVNQLFMKAEMLIINHVMLFFLVLFAIYLYSELKEFKEEKK